MSGGRFDLSATLDVGWGMEAVRADRGAAVVVGRALEATAT